MFTSRAQALSSIRNGDDAPIDVGDLAYFQSRLRNRIFDLILTKFVQQRETTGLTKAILARRIGRAPAVITRYLSAPSNLTIETISDLLLGIGGEELDPVSSAIDAPNANIEREQLLSTEWDYPSQVKQSGFFDEPANNNSPLINSSLYLTVGEQRGTRSSPWR